MAEEKKKMTFEEQLAAAKQKEKEAIDKRKQLEASKFWEKNGPGLSNFWQTQVKEHNKKSSDLDLLKGFVKACGMRGIEITKKEPKPKKTEASS